jgi:hypothetical protein
VLISREQRNNQPVYEGHKKITTRPTKVEKKATTLTTSQQSNRMAARRFATADKEMVRLKLLNGDIDPEDKPKEVYDSLPAINKKYELEQFRGVYGRLKANLKKGDGKKNGTVDCCFFIIVVVVVVIIVVVDTHIIVVFYFYICKYIYLYII